ncbi:hypothetical protein BBO99_00004101, partial [Phytophthora kernoviae]
MEGKEDFDFHLGKQSVPNFTSASTVTGGAICNKTDEGATVEQKDYSWPSTKIKRLQDLIRNIVTCH